MTKKLTKVLKRLFPCYSQYLSTLKQRRSQLNKLIPKLRHKPKTKEKEISKLPFTFLEKDQSTDNSFLKRYYLHEVLDERRD
jgi:hypothetical protein